ncbi:hypothetical protein K3G63_03240 [Hymenobacter sp. HSC-4F20]|uniref:hypothetical protein n=1 Tax=Hymenobacter sp. HSC-4F20 TaxID=2864135 RepID=UPI001C72DDB8|nr:hypothetical protein [Hymenobacter sp. HSC-4F20]MBX0289433.1 hypothetical protein [Hymenobacter sp. HSC-4F20]
MLLNQKYLLSLEFRQGYQGFEQPDTNHLTFELRTGRLLTLADVVADSSAQLGRRLQAALSRRLRDNLADVAATYGDSTQLAHVAGGEWYDNED